MEQVIKNKHLNFEIRFRYGDERCERFMTSLKNTKMVEKALQHLESIYKLGGAYRFFDFSKAGENKEILYNKIITLDKQYN